MLDDVEDDYRSKGVQKWVSKASDKQKWGKIVEKS